MRVEAGLAFPAICKELVVSTTTYYRWKSKYGGLDASELTRTRELEAQLSEFKQIAADLTLESKVMKGLIAKKL